MAEIDLPPVYTIGHSTRTIDAFVDLLRVAGVRRLVDIRGIPRSRTNPQYNLDTLRATLAARQIDHAFIPELGGRRGRQKNVATEVNGYWENDSFHNYADYAMSRAFRGGLAQLSALADEASCAIMCSEAVWWRCHRRIVADYLIAARRPVFHLMAHDRIEPATMTPGAVVEKDVLLYPAAATT